MFLLLKYDIEQDFISISDGDVQKIDHKSSQIAIQKVKVIVKILSTKIWMYRKFATIF